VTKALAKVQEVIAPGVSCAECARPSAEGSILCGPHLRGLALAALDCCHWPRLRLRGGRVVRGDDA